MSLLWETDRLHWEALQAQRREGNRPRLAGLIGVDEVGRGSLIGSIVAAAVYFPSPQWDRLAQGELATVNDSKKLPALKREILKASILANGVTGIGEATQLEVETLNVVRASQLASIRALTQVLSQLGGHAEDYQVLVDGRLPLANWAPDNQTVWVKGDSRSAHIAAASIVAKQHRDAWVIEQAARYPHYGWSTNMGYATQAHRQALANHGPSPLHRRTFFVQPLPVTVAADTPVADPPADVRALATV